MPDGSKDAISAAISSPAELVEEARAGRMVILVDDEDRENEGDLVIPAQFATPDVVNFMGRHARGLICLALAKARVDALGLPLMAQSNGTRHQTAFTVSIEAREGVTTGISAPDRARTIAVAIDPESGRNDIVTPGHVFPLVARDGGVLVRAGHTEAAVDLARLAGLNPSGVICEILKENGEMARLPDLVAFAGLHDLKIGTIADLIAYRRRSEKLVRRVAETSLTKIEGGDWFATVYEDTVNRTEHLVLSKGVLAGDAPPLVRVHVTDVLGDMLGGPAPGFLHAAMREVAREGRGAIVLVQEGLEGGLSRRVLALDRNPRMVTSLRDYGIGAQILADLGITRMVLLSNTHKSVIGLQAYGLQIVEQRTLDVDIE
ncbi:3,4-dihydroxy-2-butanone-4-phosphate synthase [Azospirillum endophyticum]